jgi:hypothetical protein
VSFNQSEKSEEKKDELMTNDYNDEKFSPVKKISRN